MYSSLLSYKILSLKSVVSQRIFKQYCNSEILLLKLLFFTDLILQLLELQERIQAIEFWSDVLNKTASLKDVCYAPLNPENPAVTDCAINSLPQYFQNSLVNLNAKANMTELGVTKEVDWRDHLIYCVK